MFTTQKVVTVPVSGNSTWSLVGTPHVGQAPRGGTYTIWHSGHRSPRMRPSRIPRRKREGASPAVMVYSSLMGVRMLRTSSLIRLCRPVAHGLEVGDVLDLAGGLFAPVRPHAHASLELGLSLRRDSMEKGSVGAVESDQGPGKWAAERVVLAG